MTDTIRKDRLDVSDQILIDGRWSGPYGIGRFADEVVSRLGGTHRAVDGYIPRLNPIEPVLLSAQIVRTHPDIFYTPSFTVPWRAPCPVVATVHDLIHLRVPGERSRAKEVYYERLLKPVLRHSPVILTVSEFSRGEIAEWLGIGVERIEVVGDGTDMSRDDVEPGESGMTRPYLLYVGNAKEHKNLPRLIRAFERARIDDLELVLVGPHDDRRGPSVRPVGQVDDRQLRRLYRDAAAVVMPSTYEGFGLPALEGLAMGTPVLASRIPPLEATLGELGVYVDPTDVDSIADGLHKVVDPALRTDELVERRTKRAAEFSWDDVASRTEAALARALHTR
ncbi:MAG: glycosyltransferase family 4 protein [Actinobacteria bacterium]|nr:glycosyltransferase family 4 protein [Actinomycetota bacterium]